MLCVGHDCKYRSGFRSSHIVVILLLRAAPLCAAGRPPVHGMLPACRICDWRCLYSFGLDVRDGDGGCDRPC